MTAPDKLEPRLICCPTCEQQGAIPKWGSFILCPTCRGQKRFNDRRRPTPSPDPAELIRLAEAWVAACGDLHTVTSEHYADEAAYALIAAEQAFRNYVATLAGEKP